MDPGQSVYDQKVLYVGFDLTACLTTNSTAVISAKIGNGKWGYLDIYTNRTLVNDQSGDSTRSFILYAFAELSNGTRTELVTNANEWSYRHGPIVYDHMWHGEIYDARQETALWISPAIQMNPKIGILVPQNMPPIRITKTYSPVSIRTFHSCKRFLARALLATRDINVNQATRYDIRYDGSTPLSLATENNHTEIIQLLKDAGAQHCSLYKASENGYTEVVTLLNFNYLSF